MHFCQWGKLGTVDLLLKWGGMGDFKKWEGDPSNRGDDSGNGGGGNTSLRTMTLGIYLWSISVTLSPWGFILVFKKFLL